MINARRCINKEVYRISVWHNVVQLSEKVYLLQRSMAKKEVEVEKETYKRGDEAVELQANRIILWGNKLVEQRALFANEICERFCERANGCVTIERVCDTLRY